jgi:hypothetical protein
VVRFAEDEAAALRLVDEWLGLESRDSARRRGFRHNLHQGRQFKLHLLPMASTDLDEGMKSAGCDVEAQAVREETSHLAVGSSAST